MDNKLIEKCLLTDEERLQASLIGELPLSDYEEVIRETSILLLEKAIPIIQQALLENLKQALKDSRDNKDIDLPEEWYELFNSIRNSGVRALLDVDEGGVISDDVIDIVLDEWAENETDEDFFKTDVQIEMEKAKTIAKAQHTIDEIKRKELLERLEQEAFAEPQYIPQHGKTPVVICIDEDLWRELKGE